MMLGVPGSGKSYFVRNLTETMGFIRVSSDIIRTELFGRPDAHMLDPDRPPESFDAETYTLLNQRVDQALAAGHSVVRDHMHNSKSLRGGVCRQAGAAGALPLVVWIKTPHELSHQRGMARELQPDQKPETDPDRMRRAIDYYNGCIEPPTADELCLEIDGRLDFAGQLAGFLGYCQRNSL